eukprot:g3804.t1
MFEFGRTLGRILSGGRRDPSAKQPFSEAFPTDDERKDRLKKMIQRLRGSKKKRGSFHREFVFGGKKRIDEVLNAVLSLGQRNIILSHGNAPEICSALVSAGLSAQFSSVIDTAGNYAKMKESSFEIGHLTDVAEDWTEELLKRGFSKDKFIVNAILNGLLFGGKVFSRVIYVDDKAETTTLPQDKVLVIRLPTESCGVKIEQYNQLKALDLSSDDLVIWDFDCTLAQIHMYKTMNMHMSMSWRDKWGPDFMKWFDSVFDENDDDDDDDPKDDAARKSEETTKESD